MRTVEEAKQCRHIKKHQIISCEKNYDGTYRKGRTAYKCKILEKIVWVSSRCVNCKKYENKQPIPNLIMTILTPITDYTETSLLNKTEQNTRR